MTYTLPLRALDAMPGDAPVAFEEFERRRALARHRTRQASLSAVAALGVLAMVPLVAVLTQGQPAAMVLEQATVRPSSAEVFQQAPALVDMARFALTSELEDHIAPLDAEISAARLRPVAAEELQRMERARRQLNDSLQRVNYAHALLDL